MYCFPTKQVFLYQGTLGIYRDRISASFRSYKPRCFRESVNQVIQEIHGPCCLETVVQVQSTETENTFNYV